MSRARKAADLLLPWSALIAGAVAWFLAHQIGSSALFDDCDAPTMTLAVLLGLVAIALTLAGGLASFSVYRRESESETRRFIAGVSALVGALLALATLLEAVSPLIIGSCFG